jgi:hypothetical protein
MVVLAQLWGTLTPFVNPGRVFEAMVARARLAGESGLRAVRAAAPYASSESWRDLVRDGLHETHTTIGESLLRGIVAPARTPGHPHPAPRTVTRDEAIDFARILSSTNSAVGALAALDPAINAPCPDLGGTSPVAVVLEALFRDVVGSDAVGVDAVGIDVKGSYAVGVNAVGIDVEGGDAAGSDAAPAIRAG